MKSDDHKGFGGIRGEICLNLESLRFSLSLKVLFWAGTV